MRRSEWAQKHFGAVKDDPEYLRACIENLEEVIAERDAELVGARRLQAEARYSAYRDAADMLRRHADSYTARGVGAHYYAFMQAAEIVEKMMGDVA